MSITVSTRMMNLVKSKGYFILDGVLEKLPHNNLKENDVVEFMEHPTLLNCIKFKVTKVEEFVNDLHHINKKIYVEEV